MNVEAMRVCPPAGPSSHRGFTMVEMMIVVAIIGILAAIAIPAYNSSVVKGRRAQGRTALLDVMQAQERLYTQNGAYTAVTVPGASTGTLKMTSGDSAANAAYDLSAVACAGTTLRECVIITAAPRVGDPEAGNLTLTSTGQKACDGTQKSVPGVCWP